MKNIFEGAKFGDMFVCRNGMKAVLVGIDLNVPFVGFDYETNGIDYKTHEFVGNVITLCVEDGYMDTKYNLDGTLPYDNTKEYEIVSKLNETKETKYRPVHFGLGSAKMIQDVKDIKANFGNEINCDEVLKELIGGRFRCPQCHGSGIIHETRWVTDFWDGHDETFEKECPLCKGAGYNEKDYKPKMVQTGWEENK